MRNGSCVAGLVVSGMFLLAACGSGADEFGEVDDVDAFAEESSTDPSDFPADSLVSSSLRGTRPRITRT